jgi:hypothetical protein
MSSCEVFDTNCKVEKYSGPSVRHVPLFEKGGKGKRNISTYIAELAPPRPMILYRVEDCLIGEGHEKCDFLILDCDRKAAYFVELKDSKLLKAISQLNVSLDRLLPALKASMPDVRVHARIVLSRVNGADIRDSKYVAFERRIIALGGTLKQQSQKFKERIP